ncbi:hypothetical protein I6F35_06415 [Bradyrhizobium sp. BRP22]|uniref:hypothetical protein n=1 Tax=Bradyrhizobium sp. BRP22 TaxID=2793821 RepID=UPI001CD6D127|nr:hypothetical protein [Bradyrhizobium sp. BRP22]MCA1452854.1 hypothetical protein [Bradyrhizobium sp. BRP22]
MSNNPKNAPFANKAIALPVLALLLLGGIMSSGGSHSGAETPAPKPAAAPVKRPAPGSTVVAKRDTVACIEFKDALGVVANEISPGIHMDNKHLIAAGRCVELPFGTVVTEDASERTIAAPNARCVRVDGAPRRAPCLWVLVQRLAIITD